MDLHPHEPFPYKTLKSDELRLLRVQPGNSDLIRIDLKTAETPTSQPFWALSYVWGARENPVTILLDGQPFSITRNLYHALYEYRRHVFKDGLTAVTGADVWLWVDAICINQNDQVEKSIQVPRMSDIYGKCEHVLAWLGPVDNQEEDQISRLAERLKDFSSSSENQDSNNHHRITTFMKLADSDEEIAAEVELVRKALRSIGHRPWFRRIWILQEAVLAQKRPILLCGPYELGYDIFFETWVLMLDPSQEGQLLYSFMAENPVRFKAIEAVYHKILQERTLTKKEHMKDLALHEKECALDVFKLLNETTELEATVPHDRLYALIGLLGCDLLPKALQPDYTQSFEQLCYQFAVFMLKETQDIRVLNLGTVGNFKTVPSWIPDLRNSWMARANLGTDVRIFPQMWLDGNAITLPAIVLGQCVSVSSPSKPDADSDFMPASAFLHFDECVIKPAAAIRGSTRMEVMIEWLKHHFADIYTDERLEQNPIILQRIMLAYTCMVHNQPISSLPTRYGTTEQLKGAFGMVIDPIMQRSLVGSSNFVLQNGTGGRLLHNENVAIVGDAICVFPGLSVPFLIRSNDGGKNCMMVGQVSKWETIGASLPAEDLGRYARSFDESRQGKETRHHVRTLRLQ